MFLMAIKLHGLFNAKTIPIEVILSDPLLAGFGFRIYPKDISPQANIIAWLDFEPFYYDVAVEHISHCDTGIHLVLIKIEELSSQKLGLQI